jgi:hypothetical protein
LLSTTTRASRSVVFSYVEHGAFLARIETYAEAAGFNIYGFLG